MLSSIFELAGIALIIAMPPILNLALAFSAPENFPADWDNAFKRLMLMGFIFSISLAMPSRTLPLFVRLATPPKRTFAPT